MIKRELERFKHLKILVGFPHMGQMHIDFIMSLINMLEVCKTHRFGSYKEQTVRVMHAQGSILGKLRMEIVETAVKGGFDYVLFVDSDHKFPRKLLHKLVDARKDIVAVNCVTKTLPAWPTARGWPEPDLPGGRPIYSIGRQGEADPTGLEKVWRIGTGVVLIHTKVFREIGTKCWDSFWNHEQQTWQGEDWTFFTKAQEKGFDIWIDHDLSREVTHIGWMHYTHDLSGEYRYVADSNPRAATQAADADQLAGPEGLGDPGEGSGVAGGQVGGAVQRTAVARAVADGDDAPRGEFFHGEAQLGAGVPTK